MMDNANSKKTTWETIKKLTLELDSQTDADIIKQLESKKSIEEYIKRLIREDIAKAVQIPLPGINSDLINDAEKNFDAVLSILKKVVTK